MVEYRGQLYGKIGRKYFPTGVTTEQVDAQSMRFKQLEAENGGLMEVIRKEVEGWYPCNFCQYCKHENIDFKKYCEPCKFELKTNNTPANAGKDGGQ